MDTLARSRGQLLFCTVTVTTKLDTLNPKPKLKCLPADRRPALTRHEAHRHQHLPH